MKDTKPKKSTAPKCYKIYGAILGCLGNHAKDVEYKVTENLPKDPWIAIIESKYLLTITEVNKWHKYHVVDVDKKKVPYYFIVKNVVKKLEYVWYSDDASWMPINTKDEKAKAKAAGLKKKLVESQLDF